MAVIRRKPGYGIFISLLLALLLFVSCARPGAVAENQAFPLIYAAVGDSTGIGLGARNGGGYVDRLFARIEQKRSGFALINLCTAGATTADAVNKQLAQLGSTRVTLVTICVGVNDLLRGSDEKQFAENYETLVAKLRESARSVVVANLPDVASAPAMKGLTGESLRLRLEQFNKAIEEVANRHGVPLVDLYSLSAETARSRPELFSSDGLHPSDTGYAQWAEAMWTVIEQSIN
jgi:lysophospholipase L1-like esterase